MTLIKKQKINADEARDVKQDQATQGCGRGPLAKERNFPNRDEHDQRERPNRNCHGGRRRVPKPSGGANKKCDGKPTGQQCRYYRVFSPEAPAIGGELFAAVKRRRLA